MIRSIYTRLFFVIICVIFSLSVHAQDLDQLFAIWQDETQTDSIRVNAFREYIWDGFLDSDQDTAFHFATKMIEFGVNNDYPKAKTIGLNIQGVSWELRGDRTKAFDHYDQAMKFSEQIGDQEGMAVSLKNIRAVTHPDSLWKDWTDWSLADTTRLYALNELVRRLDDRSSRDSVLLLSEQMLAFASENENILFQIIAHDWFADIHRDQEEYLEAEQDLLNVIDLGQEINQKIKIAIAYFDLGQIYYYMGQYSKSIVNYTQSGEIYKALGVPTSGLWNNIGLIYKKQEDYPKALEYFQRSARIAKEEEGRVNGAAIGNIGDVYLELGNIEKALEYFNKRIEIAEEQGGPKKMCHLSSMMVSLGNACKKMNDHNQAMEYYVRGQEYDKLGPACSKGSTIMIRIGALYQLMGQNDQAIDWCTRGYTRAKEIVSIPEQHDACECLYKAYKDNGAHKKALEYKERTDQLNDSLNKEATVKSLQQMEYAKELLADSLKRSEENLLVEMAHQQEVSKKDKTRNLLMGGALLLLLAAMGLYSRMRYIRKAKNRIEIERLKAVKSEAFKQQFLANMSHEIRTPMNAVMGMTSLLLDKQPREDQLIYLNGIRTSGDNLLHIINDILDLSKIEAGKMELEHIDFSLNASVDHVKKILDHKAAEKGLELLTSIKPDVQDIVIGDPVRLNQVLINLTGNAIKFTEKGSVSIEVSNADRGIKFSIVDTGIGIPEDKLQTVFESFTQANASDTRKHGGTGLGLSISRQLVDFMGGKMALESKEGYGTTFSFTVELEPGSSERLEERLALERDVDGSILDGLKILIADDNEYNRIVARDTLKSKANVEIHEAEDGQAAIDLVGKMRFDVILMDVQMPRMNGFDATKFIRSNFESPIKDTPIIALTASVLRTDLDKCKQAGMDSYIPKPFKAQQLITGIAQVLGIQLKASKNSPPEVSNVSSNDQGVESITDMTYLKEFCEGDAKKMKKYIGMFTSTAPGLIERISAALDANDLRDIADQVHGFKTKWIMMGMAKTKDLAMKLEDECRGNANMDSIRTDTKLLIEHVKKALIELE